MRYKPPPAGVFVPESRLNGFARRRGIPHFFLNRIHDRPTEFLHALRPDILCIAGLSRILRRGDFDIAPLGAINFHPSLLPKYRGPRPFLWQAHQMDLDGGVTIHQVDDGIDTGDILVQKSFAIRPGEPHFSIRSRALKLGSAAMLEALELLSAGRATPRPQRHLPCPLYARHVDRDEPIIDWRRLAHPARSGTSCAARRRKHPSCAPALISRAGGPSAKSTAPSPPNPPHPPAPSPATGPATTPRIEKAKSA